MSVETAVITGSGVVAPNGIGNAAFAEALAGGKSGIGDLVSFDASDTGRGRAAEIQDFDPAPFLRSPKNYLDRNSALAFAACEMAVRESGVALPDAPRGYGIAAGSMAGNLESLAAFYAKAREKGARFAPPFLFPHTYYNTTVGLLSIEYGLTGPHWQFCSGSAAGLEAVAFAAECVERGRAGLMLAGGAEAFSEWLFRLCLTRGWLSPIVGWEESCKPFAAERNGAILGEAAAFFVVESREAARSRGARPLARVAGAGISSSIHEAMSGALAHAGLDAAKIDAVFASAGGYVSEDEEEASAIAELFGAKGVPVVTLKASTGETLGAGGPLNLAAALAAMKGGMLPASPCASAFDQLQLVQETRRAPVRHVLLNAGSPATAPWISLVVGQL